MQPAHDHGNLAFRVAELERKLANVVRPGRVFEVDTERTRVRVQYDVTLEGEPAVTGWLPWLTARAGVVLTWSAPSLGEQVLLLAPTGDLAQAFVLPAIYQIPLDPPTDPRVHALLLPAGDVLKIEGAIEIAGDVTVSGAMAAREVTATGVRVRLGTHRHAPGQSPTPGT